ncbi:MAG: hypothetical protein HY908_15320 [Myxococcales bacterium]|nr:hypothetical protein [Myxococcales bacterium]
MARLPQSRRRRSGATRLTLALALALPLGCSGTLSGGAATQGGVEPPAPGPRARRGGAEGAAPAITALAGAWTFQRFLGGPPEDGQITDTTELDPAAGRHAHLVRQRAGGAAERSCETEAPDGTAWTDLLAALADPDLRAALAHPERVPRLPLDAGYFSCRHAGVALAVSDVPSSDAAARALVAALVRLRQAYLRVHAELIAAPACAGL